jgi:hypothetical protein
MLSGSVPGTAPDGNGTSVPFNVQWANQRPGLLLQGGYVFIGFASHGDNGPWHGWILGYNATTLQQTGIWNTSPNGKGNGIWGAGSGIAVDSGGNAYVSTGNGDDTVTIPAPRPSKTIDYGDSIVRVSLANGNPTPTDYFTPYNQASLDASDADLGSGGVLIPPDQTGPYPHILIEAGKSGEIYVVNRDQMTSDGSHYCNGCSSDPEIIQSVGGIGDLWSMPTYWNGNVYTWGNGDHLKAFTLSAGRLSTSPTSQSAESSGFPGSTAAVSSNGTTNGIVWAVESDAHTSNGPAILRAYNANNVSTLLYGSNLTSGRDQLGPAVKFVVPVVTNGKVYVGAQMEVDVFGLLGSEPQTAAPVMNPPAGSYSGSVSVTMSSPTPNATIYYTTDGSAPSTASNLYSAAVHAHRHHHGQRDCHRQRLHSKHGIHRSLRDRFADRAPEFLPRCRHVRFGAVRDVDRRHLRRRDLLHHKQHHAYAQFRNLLEPHRGEQHHHDPSDRLLHRTELQPRRKRHLHHRRQRNNSNQLRPRLQRSWLHLDEWQHRSG